MNPRIYLIGNPDELGYTEIDTSTDLSVDSDGVGWYHATITASDLIFVNEEDPPKGLHGQWFEGSLYEIEATKTKEEWDQSRKFRELLEKAEKDDKVRKKLFELSPPIRKYAIPEDGTNEREIFNQTVRMVVRDMKRRDERRKEIRQHLGEIDRAL